MAAKLAMRRWIRASVPTSPRGDIDIIIYRLLILAIQRGWSDPGTVLHFSTATDLFSTLLEAPLLDLRHHKRHTQHHYQGGRPCVSDERPDWRRKIFPRIRPTSVCSPSRVEDTIHKWYESNAGYRLFLVCFAEPHRFGEPLPWRAL